MLPLNGEHTAAKPRRVFMINWQELSTACKWIFSFWALTAFGLFLEYKYIVGFIL